MMHLPTCLPACKWEGAWWLLTPCLHLCVSSYSFPPPIRWDMCEEIPLQSILLISKYRHAWKWVGECVPALVRVSSRASRSTRHRSRQAVVKGGLTSTRLVMKALYVRPPQRKKCTPSNFFEKKFIRSHQIWNVSCRLPVRFCYLQQLWRFHCSGSWRKIHRPSAAHKSAKTAGSEGDLHHLQRTFRIVLCVLLWLE